MENIEYLSDRIQNCFIELFVTSYEETDDYMKSLVEVSNYLLNNNNKHDNILSKYDGVSKSLLNQMILSNFLEISYYRRKNGIQLDDIRLNILNSVENENTTNGSISLLYCDIHQFSTMINDVLLYFWHPSPIYSYNAVKSMYQENFAKLLYQIYPLSMNEHALTLNDSFNQKEFLLYTLIESMINATERLSFSNSTPPIPNPGYLQNIANKLKECNGTDPLLPNLHKEILEEFNSKAKISKGINYDKILILEMLISTIQTKQSCFIPLSKNEKNIIESLNPKVFSLEYISNFYDFNEEKIISSLITDWNMFSNETILLDTKIFESIKKTDTNNFKKR